MSAKQIIAEIDGLPEKRRQEVYDYVLQKTRRKEHALSVLEKIKGVGKGCTRIC